MIRPSPAWACVQVLEEGIVNARLQPSNAATEVSIVQDSIPLEAVAAGATVSVAVHVATEDGKPLAYDDAARGLSLTVIAPGSNSKAGQARAALLCVHDRQIAFEWAHESSVL